MGLILLILGKKYVPYAPLLGGREPGSFVLLVKVLDLLLRRLELAYGLIPDLLDEKASPDLLLKRALRVAKLLEGFLEKRLGISSPA